MKKTIIIHPIVLFLGIWTIVSFLYLLKLSSIFLYDFNEVIYIVGFGMMVPFFLTWIIYWLVQKSFSRPICHSNNMNEKYEINEIKIKIRQLLYLWIFGTIVEIYVSGGLPIFWLYSGSEKNYMDFGISSIHGFLNSLISSIAISSLWLFLKAGEKKYLLLGFLAIIWAIFAVARQLIILNLIQILVLYFLIRGLSWRMMLVGFISITIAILFFGVMGDSRSGSSAIASIAYVENYPNWLPSGFLWVYIYMTSPLNNLLYTVEQFPNSLNLGVANTFSSLIPTMLRTRIFPEGIDFVPLVSEQLNMSSAYYGPFRDLGISGVMLYSFLLCLVSCFYWYKNKENSLLFYAVLAQCIVGSIFYNSLFFLPSIFQLVWIGYIFKSKKRKRDFVN